ncbi:translation initiation factor eIF3 subunit [Ascobolus immersus RN42]|uniref:Eukaryotic translation initiation factor 3 subunit J n=1 Tax=Ascobolus immersus RN42 TaxID=1160509 RepID=A0A3N4I442_ASCIM|nr:translation initiation factor eIF3 subunit [Ascobolus immersus RN42]
MPGNWDEESSGDEAPATRIANPIVKARSKWEDEESDNEVLDSWDAEDSEAEREKEEKAKKAAEEAAANRKSKAARIAEHQAAKAAQKKAEEEEAARYANETPAERKAREQARQIEEDLKHAESLFGATVVAGDDDNNPANAARRKAVALTDPKNPSNVLDLSLFPVFNPRTKADFAQLREILVPLLTANSKKPTYPDFVVDFTRELCKELSSEHTRKAGTALTTLSNEKQRAEKEAEKGGKKKKGAQKAKLAAVSKANDHGDALVDYTKESSTYDDFDDFM